jgi:hypothetical protein
MLLNPPRTKLRAPASFKRPICVVANSVVLSANSFAFVGVIAAG